MIATNNFAKNCKKRYITCLLVSICFHFLFLIDYFYAHSNLSSTNVIFIWDGIKFFAFPLIFSSLLLSYTMFDSVCQLMFFLKIDAGLIDIRLHGASDGPPDPLPVSRLATFTIIYPVSIAFFLCIIFLVIPAFPEWQVQPESLRH